MVRRACNHVTDTWRYAHSPQIRENDFQDVEAFFALALKRTIPEPGHWPTHLPMAYTEALAGPRTPRRVVTGALAIAEVDYGGAKLGRHRFK